MWTFFCLKCLWKKKLCSLQSVREELGMKELFSQWIRRLNQGGFRIPSISPAVSISRISSSRSRIIIIIICEKWYWYSFFKALFFHGRITGFQGVRVRVDANGIITSNSRRSSIIIIKYEKRIRYRTLRNSFIYVWISWRILPLIPGKISNREGKRHRKFSTSEFWGNLQHLSPLHPWVHCFLNFTLMSLWVIDDLYSTAWENAATAGRSALNFQGQKWILANAWANIKAIISYLI